MCNQGKVDYSEINRKTTIFLRRIGWTNKAMESFIDSSNINLINNQRAIYSSYILDNIGMNDSDMYNIE